MPSLKEWTAIAKYRLGFMSQSEVSNTLLPAREQFLAKALPHERYEAKMIFDELDQLKTVRNFDQFLSSSFRLTQITNHAAIRHKAEQRQSTHYENYVDVDKAGFTGTMDSSYALQGGNVWRYFLNPFSVFSMYAEMHWAVYLAIDWLLSEVMFDGFHLIPKRNVTDAARAEANRIVEQYGLRKLRLSLLKSYGTYGNCLVLPHKRLWPGGITRFENLVMDRSFPIWNTITEELTGWDYWIGPRSTAYRKEDLLHLCKPSLRYPDIGLPPAAPLAIDLESSLGSSSLNNQVIQKAGMIGLVLALKPPSEMDGENAEAVIARMRADIRNMHSGAKNPNGVLIETNIEDVYKISQIGDFEGSFLRFDDAIARKVAAIFKVAVERMYVNFKSAGVYEAAAVHSGSNEVLDKSIHSWISPVDDFLNTYILPSIGLEDFQILARGRYGNLSLNGAKSAYVTSQVGGLFTKNQMLMFFYGMPPMEGEEGNKLVDNSTARDPMLLPQIMGEPMQNDDMLPPGDDEEPPAPKPAPKPNNPGRNPMSTSLRNKPKPKKPS